MYHRTSLIKTPKEQSEVSVLERCPYKEVTMMHPFLTRGYAKRRNGFLLGLRYANVSLAHSGVESS